MGAIKDQIIEALRTGNMDEVRSLKQLLAEEAERERWLAKFKDNSIPIREWIFEPNPFISFTE